jgi:hypothetical protein
MGCGRRPLFEKTAPYPAKTFVYLPPPAWGIGLRYFCRNWLLQVVRFECIIWVKGKDNEI